MKLLTFLRSVQDSPMFANIALHAWGGALLVFAIGEHFRATYQRAALVVVALAIFAAKEFWFDANYEIPPQPAGSIRGGGGLQDFAGYVLGVAIAVTLWLL
jgi:hypothetical protein